MFFNSNRAKKMDDIPGKLSVLIPSWIFFCFVFFRCETFSNSRLDNSSQLSSFQIRFFFFPLWQTYSMCLPIYLFEGSVLPEIFGWPYNLVLENNKVQGPSRSLACTNDGCPCDKHIAVYQRLQVPGRLIHFCFEVQSWKNKNCRFDGPAVQKVKKVSARPLTL